MARASLQNIFKIPTHSRCMAGRKAGRKGRGGGLKFHDNKKCFLHVILINLVGMVISYAEY